MARMHLGAVGIAVIAVGVLFGSVGLFLLEAATERWTQGMLIFAAWVLVLVGIVMTGFYYANRKSKGTL